MPIMKMNELEEAHTHWCEHHGICTEKHYLKLENTFKTFCKLHSHVSVTWADKEGNLIKVPEYAARRIRLLTSPHWKALLIAHMIRTKKSSVEVISIS